MAPSSDLRSARRSSVTPFNRALDTASALLSPGTHKGAILLDKMVTHEAQIVAYANDYTMLIWTTLPIAVLLLLMRVPSRR